MRIGTDLADACDEGGSGVWIAPGVVLSCAHVVPSGLDSKVEVGWAGKVLSGTVIDHVPAESQEALWSFPDLAIIMVADVPEHPCAWLSEALPGRELVAFGHSSALGEGLRPATVEGLRGGVHDFGAGRVWQFKGNEIAGGMSGGPVLDVASGAICGIVTVTIGEGADRGGYVIPIEALRHLDPLRRHRVLSAHDRFHGANTEWVARRTELPAQPDLLPSSLTPDEEAGLLARLAELPAKLPSELLALMGRSSNDGRLVLRHPTTLRDVVYALLDERGCGSDPALPVLRMVQQLVGTDPQTGTDRALYDWATAVAGRRQCLNDLQTMREAVAHQRGRSGGLVSVEIVPGTAKIDRFRLTVSVQDDEHGPRPIYQDKEPVLAIEQVREVACAQLRMALGWLAGNAQVEFVVPIELFDEPFDELVPTQPYTNLGRKFRVVLRDYDRQIDPITHHDWQQRWHQLMKPSRHVRWIACDENLTPEEFSAELEQRPDITGVMLARRPSSSEEMREILRVAIDSGVPVAVWRRDTCAEHDMYQAGDECSGLRFRTAFDSLSRSHKMTDLPETVRMLRNKSAGRQATSPARDCRSIVLLWDDPARVAQPISSVHEPPYHPLETAI